MVDLEVVVRVAKLIHRCGVIRRRGVPENKPPRAALIALLKRALEYDRYPMAPRLDPLKAILAKLEPPPPVRTGLVPGRPRGSPWHRHDPPQIHVTAHSRSAPFSMGERPCGAIS